MVHHLKARKYLTSAEEHYERTDAAAFFVLCTDIINPKNKWTTQILREKRKAGRKTVMNIMKLMCLNAITLSSAAEQN